MFCNLCCYVFLLVSKRGNYNKKEAQLIIKYLEDLKKKKVNQTVGIITPFTDQQKTLL